VASRLDLSSPWRRNGTQMTYIYNVDGHVGPYRSNENFPDDVELVQFFLREYLKKDPSGRIAQNVFRTLPTLSRQMDVVTAYWIIRWQDTHTDTYTVDGIVSPARGVTYGGLKIWQICSFNLLYKQIFGEEAFARIPINSELSLSLRKALQRL
jgi:hypothetical protein